MKAKDRLIKYRAHFAVSVSSLLFITALAKLIGIAQDEPFLTMPDGVFPFVNTKDILGFAALLEVIVATFLILKRYDLVAIMACAWLTALFSLYHILAKALFVQQPCRCLGGIFDWTRLPQTILNNLPIILLLYIAIGSVVFLIISSYSSAYSSSLKTQKADSEYTE